MTGCKFSNNARILFNKTSLSLIPSILKYKGKSFKHTYITNRQIHTRITLYIPNSSQTSINLFTSVGRYLRADNTCLLTLSALMVKGCIRLLLLHLSLTRLKHKRSRLNRLRNSWVQSAPSTVAGSREYYGTYGAGACCGDSKGHNG